MPWHHSTLLWFTNLHNGLTGRNTQAVKEHMNRTPWTSESFYNIQIHVEINSFTWRITTSIYKVLTHTVWIYVTVPFPFFYTSSHRSPSIHLRSLTLTFGFTLLSHSLSTPLYKCCIFHLLLPLRPSILPSHHTFCNPPVSLQTFDWGSDLRLRAPERLHISEMDSLLWFTER